MKKKADQAKAPNEDELKIAELTADLQRVRADFENFRKRVEFEKEASVHYGEEKATKALLPIIDTVERAIEHTPKDIANHEWVKGIQALSKQLQKIMNDLGLERIPAEVDMPFNPEVHQAVQFDDSTDGEHEVIASVLQHGYTYRDRTLRPTMANVARK